MKKRIVVLGSNCFSGSHLVDCLLENGEFQVTGISRSPEKDDLYLPYKKRTDSQFSFYQIDMVKESKKLYTLLDKLKPEIVVNFAALTEVFRSVDEPLGYYQTNTNAVAALCEHLKRKNYLERYVHISSAEIYGTCSSAIKEDHQLNPTTPYAVSKAAADYHLLSLYRHSGFPVNLVRSTNVYGSHQQLFKIIPRTIIFLKMNKKIMLHGGGKVVRSFIHIRDVCEGILKVISKGRPGEIYHFATDYNKTISETVQLVCSTMGFNFERSVEFNNERALQDGAYFLDIEKSRNELGWDARIPMLEGIQDTIDWIETNWQKIKKEPLEYIHKV